MEGLDGGRRGLAASDADRRGEGAGDGAGSLAREEIEIRLCERLCRNWRGVREGDDSRDEVEMRAERAEGEKGVRSSDPYEECGRAFCGVCGTKSAAVARICGRFDDSAKMRESYVDVAALDPLENDDSGDGGAAAMKEDSGRR